MSEIIKRALSLFLCVAITLGICVNASAESTDLRITGVEITGKSETAIVEEPSITENQIQGGVVFDTQGDFANYLFTIENVSEFNYRIDGIESNNTVEALSVVFDHDEKVLAGSTANFSLHLEYTEKLINRDSIDISDLEITLRFTKIEDSGGGEEEPEEKSDVSPDTYDGVIGCILGSSVAIVVAMFTLRNMLPRKLRIAGDGLALALAGTAFGLHAANAAIYEEIIIKFSNINLVSEYEDYTITIDTGNGPVETTVQYGTPLSEILVRPTKTGYHFDKWTDDAGNTVSENGVIEGPISITANMAPNHYRVVFNSNDGTEASASQDFEYDDSQDLANNSFTRAGYTFAGWATSADGEVVYEDGEDVLNLTTEDDATIELFAKWTLRTDIDYIVRHSYENLMNDGYTDEDVLMQGSVDTDITPELQPRAGYVTPAQKTERINADGSTIINYVYDLERVEFALNDTDYIQTETPAGTYKYGYPITVTAINRTGYDFNGWSNGSSIVTENQSYSFEIKNNTSLTPSYVIQRFTVTIDLNNGTTPAVHNNVEYNTFYSELLPAQPSKTGYTFVNWTDADSNVISGESKVTGAATVTANYSANSYQVSFNANEGTGEMNNQSFTYDEACNLTTNSFTRPGYNFAGWATSASGAVEYADGAEVSNLTSENNATVELFARWTLRTDIDYIVRHSYENLTDDNYTDEDIPRKGSVDTDITPELQPRTGYVTPSQKTERINADGSSIITYVYNRERETLSLENTEFIETGSSAASEYKYGATITLTAKTRESHNFLGWSNGSSIVSTDLTYEFTITNTVTLSPSYEIKKFTVTVDRGGAQPETHNNVEYGTALSTILGEQPTKTGYHFTAWTDQYTRLVTGEETVAGDMVITANFAANNYTVTFHRNDGSDVTAQQSMVYDTASTLAQNSFTRGGYTFAGWATSADGEVAYTDEAQVSNLTTENNGNVDLFAKWDKLHNIHYTVIHRYQQVTGDGYDETIIDANDGAVDEDNYPALRPQTGFVTPAQQTISNMDPSGSSSVTYVYNREVLQLTINANDVTTDTPSGEYRYGCEISVTAATREGYDFINWTDSSDAELTTNKAYSFTLTQNASITPNYEIKKFTITINPGNGDASITHQNVEWGTVLSTILPAPIKTGYHFTAWTDQYTRLVTGEETVAGDMTITGHFSANNYNVSFNANGGTGTMADESFTYDTVAKALSANDFIRPGYNFAGWATSSDGAVVYENEESVQNLTTENNGTVALFAKWTLRTDIPYTVYHRYENVKTGFTEVEVTEHGSVDTDITPPVAQEPGFNDAVADGSTPVPTRIEADGSSFVIYNYYRLSKTLTIDDEMFVDTETYSGSYKYGTQIELTAIERENFDFAGWIIGTSTSFVSTDKTYSFTLTDDITIHPVYAANPFKTLYSHTGACAFDGDGNVTGDDCGEDPGYINTGVMLYDTTNYERDYEIGFTIDAIGANQVNQATVMNSKLEDESANFPGIAARKGTNNEFEITQRINSNAAKKTTWSAPKTIKIIRYNHVVYTQIDNGTPERLQSMANTSAYHNIPVWFGATYIPSTGSADRLFNGTISNMYVKRGVYDGNTATITFDMGEDSATAPDPISILSGTSIAQLPADPVSASGQFFVGWYTDEGTWINRITKDTVFSGDTTVYARWVSSSNACEVDGVAKESLKECVDLINDGTSSTGRIEILRDINPVTDNNTDIYIDGSKDITIDGNGHRLTAATTKPVLRNEDGGTLRLDNVKIFTNATQGAINNKQNGYLYVNNCEIIVGTSSSNFGTLRQAIYSEYSSVEITGNTIIESYSSARSPVQNKGGSITIKSAKITAHKKTAVEGTDGAVISIGDDSDPINREDPIIISDAYYAVTANVGISFYDGTLIAKGSNSVRSPLASGTTITNYPSGAVQKTDKWTAEYDNTYYWLYYSLDGGS